MDKRETRYRIYKTQLMLNPAILQVVKQTHSFFLQPIGYDRNIHEIFDDYSANGLLDNLINKIAWLILYLELIVSFLVLFYVVYLFFDID